MVLTNRCDNKPATFDAIPHYNHHHQYNASSHQQHQQQSPYNDVNLFGNSMASVNTKKMLPTAPPPVSLMPQQQAYHPSHISSNGYYGFVHIHHDIHISTYDDSYCSDGLAVAPNYSSGSSGGGGGGGGGGGSESHQSAVTAVNDESVTVMEVETSLSVNDSLDKRKRCHSSFSAENVDCVSSKRCRRDWEDMQMAADDNIMSDESEESTTTATVIDCIAPSSFERHDHHQQQQMLATLDAFACTSSGITDNTDATQQGGNNCNSGPHEISRCMMSHIKIRCDRHILDEDVNIAAGQSSSTCTTIIPPPSTSTTTFTTQSTADDLIDLEHLFWQTHGGALMHQLVES